MEKRRKTNLKVWQLIMLLALFLPVSLFAQTIEVKGTVSDASGMSNYWCECPGKRYDQWYHNRF